MDQQKIKDFTDLTIWKVSHDLVLCIYKLSERFPKFEKFGLSSQIQRASVSITSNIDSRRIWKTLLIKKRFNFII